MSNFDVIKSKLSSLLAEIDEINAGHDSIRADDDQYEDPEEWWSRPLKTQLDKALSDMDHNY